MSKVFSAVMIIVVETTAIVGSSNGKMIPRKTCHSFAPSTRAASSSSVLMPFRPADRMTIAKPVHIQTMITMRAIVADAEVGDLDAGERPQRRADR